MWYLRTTGNSFKISKRRIVHYVRTLTMQGSWLSPWRERSKREVVHIFNFTIIVSTVQG